MLIQADFTKARPNNAPVQATFRANLKRGRVSYLVGPSRSGKTTLLRILQGVLRPDLGHILADGQIWFQGEIGRFIEVTERSVGGAFEDDVLSRHQTLLAILLRALHHWPTQTRADRAMGMLERFGLERRARSRVLDLDDEQHVRLRVARALAPRHRLVLLDAPYANLGKDQILTLEHDLRAVTREENVSVLLSNGGTPSVGCSGDLLLPIEGGKVGQPVFHLPRAANG